MGNGHGYYQFSIDEVLWKKIIKQQKDTVTVKIEKDGFNGEGSFYQHLNSAFNDRAATYWDNGGEIQNVGWPAARRSALPAQATFFFQFPAQTVRR